MTEVAPAVEATALWMRYGRTVALKGVSLTVTPGTIHALVGENGAGKSTFLSIVAGRTKASAGKVDIHGEPLEGGSPRAARELGVAAVYQELMVVPALSAVENVFLGSQPTHRGVIATRAMQRRYAELCAELGVSIPATAPVRTLSVADQQALEIMRGLQADARVLLLDEPTSALALTERERLFDTIRGLQRAGVSSLFVSHDLEDVLELAETVTVFRDGSVVATQPAADWTRRELVSAMLGHVELPRQPQSRRRRGGHGDDRMLSVRGLTLPGALTDIDLEVRRGEVVGLGGLLGSGRTSVMRCVAGDVAGRARGELAVAGRPRRLPRSAAQAASMGIGLIPENRRTQGLVFGMSALENIALPELRGNPLGRFSRRTAGHRAREAALRVQFDPGRLATPAGKLSGGNQQKLLLARWINRPNLRVLLADEPTRGVDVGAKAEILETLRGLADDGLAIVFASSELEELELIADRVVVLAEGRAVAEMRREAGDISAAAILHAAFGTEKEVEAQ